MAKKPVAEKVRIESLAYGGDGVGKLGDGKVAFIERTVPGDLVEAKLYKIKKDYALGYPLDILELSQERIKARCPHFDEGCGGCTWQFIPYEYQKEEKQRQFYDALQRIGGFDIGSEPICGSGNEIWDYRNKMEYSYGLCYGQPGENTEGLGLHLKGRWSRILNLKTCFLINEKIDEFLAASREMMLRSGLPVYDPKSNEGFWQNIILRRGVNTSERLINIVCHDKEQWQKNKLGLEKIILSGLGKFKPSGVLISFPRHSQVSYDSDFETIFGKNFLTEELGQRKYRINPFAFFQTNTNMAEKLFDFVLDCADFKGDENVLDLYCGIGSIALYLAGNVNSVLGLEVMENAVLDARENAKLNNISNVRFIAGLAEKILPEIAKSEQRFDTVIADPPRSGLHEKAVRALIELSPDKIIYVSCNPTTLARDLKILIEEGGYSLNRARAFDLFPQTYHIEGVALLTK